MEDSLSAQESMEVWLLRSTMRLVTLWYSAKLAQFLLHKKRFT